MNAQDRQQELLNLVRAKFPLIYIKSGEERRVQAAVIAVAKALNMDTHLWSITSGMRKAGAAEAAEADDPMTAMEIIESTATRALFVLRDFDPYIEQTGANVVNIRKLRELADSLTKAKREQARTIIILSPKLVLPDSLRESTVVLDWPLPDRDELRAAAATIVSSLPSDMKAGMPSDDKGLDALLGEVATSAQGLTLVEAQNAFALSAIKHKAVRPPEVLAYKEQAVAKGGLLEWRRPKGGFERVAGLDVLRTWLVERRAGFSEEAMAYGLEPPRGVLLTGVAGCGKSAMADAAAKEWGIPSLGWDVGKTYGKYQGESEGQMRQVIAIAEAVAPCILRVDEIEKGFAGMNGSGEADSGTSGRMGSTFLTWMQEKTAPVFVYATCNDADKLPAELLRKGRFSEVFFIDLPNEEERAGIWRVHIGLRGRDPAKFDIAALVEASSTMSGAEIEASFVDAMFSAFAKGEEVNTSHVMRAVQQTVPLNKMAPERVEKMRAWAKGKARLASSPIAKERNESSRFSALEA